MFITPKVAHAPEVFYELDLVPSRLIRKVLDFLAWLSYVVPAAVTPISAGYKRRIVSKYGVCAEKIHIIEVGVDGVKPLNVNENLKDRFVVMCSGVLGLGYDFDVVLRAAGLLVKNEDVVFVTRGIGELASKLRRQIKSLNLGKRARRDKERTHAYFDADVYVLPSRYETFPMALLEAYACGKPVVASRVGGLKDLVIDKVTGLLVEPENAKHLANAILCLLNNDDEAEEMGLRGSGFVKENFAIEKVVDKLERLYEDIIDNKSHRNF